jgi:hypothetical protein
MKKSVGTRYVPGYDLFKLIVAIILTIILIYLMLQESNRKYALLESAIPSPSPTEMNQSIEPARTLEPTATPASESVLPTEIVTEVAVLPTETPAIVEASPEPTVAPTEKPTPTPPQATNPNDCPANPTRIQTGIFVKVLDWLNFRTGPGLHYEIQHTNKPGTELEVIGGPVCTIWRDDPPGAYLWWNVRMESGQEGWSAEAPLNFPNYFLEPTE